MRKTFRSIAVLCWLGVLFALFAIPTMAQEPIDQVKSNSTPGYITPGQILTHTVDITVGSDVQKVEFKVEFGDGLQLKDFSITAPNGGGCTNVIPYTVTCNAVAFANGGHVRMFVKYLARTNGQGSLTSKMSYKIHATDDTTRNSEENHGWQWVGQEPIVEEVKIWTPNTMMSLGTQATVPVLVSNTSGNILSYQFVVRYHTEIFDVVAYPFETAVQNTISQGFTGKIDYSEPGVVKIAAFGTNPLQGEGALIKLNFQPKAIENSIGMLIEEAMFNAGSPTAVAESGSMTVNPISITGHVWYARANQNPVIGVRLDATGPVNDLTRTEENGFFNHYIFQTGSYSIRPSDDGNIGYIPQITAEDAGAILGLVFEQPSGNMLRVADVDGDEKVTAFDAALVARHVVGLIDIPSAVGEWIFNPEMLQLNVQQSIEGQDFIAMMKGDVTALEPEVRSIQGSPEINFEGAVGEVRLQVTGHPARGYTVNLSYDPSACKFALPSESHEMSVIYNDKVSGIVQVAVFDAEASELDLSANFAIESACAVTLDSIQIGNDESQTVNQTVMLSPIVATKWIFLPAISSK